MKRMLFIGLAAAIATAMPARADDIQKLAAQVSEFDFGLPADLARYSNMVSTSEFCGWTNITFGPKLEARMAKLKDDAQRAKAKSLYEAILKADKAALKPGDKASVCTDANKADIAQLHKEW
jgi:glutamate-1-semialdehyde aminotransferase